MTTKCPTKINETNFINEITVSMKKYMVLIVVVCLLSISSQAQWKKNPVAGEGHAYLEDLAGRVGIGTADGVVPSEKLHVIGNALANQYSATTGTFNSTGSSNLLLSTNGASRLTILNTSGFVGIGTTPTEMLHVNGNVLSNQYSATNGIYNAASNLSLNTANNARLTILNTNGYVGIGTASPSEMLQVSGNVLSNQYSATNGIYNAAGNLSLSTAANARLTILNTNGFIGVGTTSPSEMLHVSGNVLSNQYSASNGIYNATTNLSLRTNDTERLTVLNGNGFVGVGVAAPTEMLHVNGNVLSNQYSAGNGIYNAVGNFSLRTNDAERLTVQNSNGFVGIGIAAPSEMLHVNGNTLSEGNVIVKGKVGIGTSLATNPNGYTLAVNGRIGAKDVRVEKTSSTWPDYVFAPSYKLPSLREVEQFIKQYSHLKDVPSASEVETNGHSLGDMDAVLLKKVEELTLYIIEQQKQIDELKKKIEAKQ
jgi:hypothetical protein